MNPPTTRGFAVDAASWTADAGPPVADLLPRAERRSASFSTRILAHVLGSLAARSPVPLSSMPWVFGRGDRAAGRPLDLALRRALGPRHAVGGVEAGSATVPMALIEALAHLARNPVVLVAFARDAIPPHHEAMAAALLLARTSTPSCRLVLPTPTLRRTFTPSEHKPLRDDPMMVAQHLAHAINVGEPTVRTVPSCGPDLSEHWCIELCGAF